MSPVRALALGVVDVIKAPLVLLAIAIAMLAIALPFAASLQSRLQESLSVQPPVSLNETEIDPEWWMEFREQARGLEATFTPAVLGFAATLDGVSAVVDGRRPPAALVAPLLLSIVAWAFIWGGALHRFQRGRGLGAAEFTRSGLRHLVMFVLIAVAAAAINLILYLTLHKLLFGPVHSMLVDMTSTERDAFLVRVLLYAIFFSVVAVVSLVADYTRVTAVAIGATSPLDAVGNAIGFIRERTGAVIALYLLTASLFIVITVAYGTLEIYGGSQVGGWRAIAIGQAYVFVRLAIRLTFASSELRLFNATSSRQAATAEYGISSV